MGCLDNGVVSFLFWGVFGFVRVPWGRGVWCSLSVEKREGMVSSCLCSRWFKFLQPARGVGAFTDVWVFFSELQARILWFLVIRSSLRCGQGR